MTDTVLIVGAGIAGLQAAIEVTNAGAQALVIERSPFVGGRLAATMTEKTAIGKRAGGESVPLFEEIRSNENIEVITLAQLEHVEGRAGNFTVRIHERARFVTDQCTRCGLCRPVCPVVRPNEWDAGLTYRKAIYSPMNETLPSAWVIDEASCLNTPPNYLPCNRCVEVCDDDAIHFDLPLDTVHERTIGAVILAPGFRVMEPRGSKELGYGKHPDIVLSSELQRLLESPGPTGGFASKPSNEEYPESVLLVLDELSHFGLYVAASQVHQLREQDIETVDLLVLEQLHDDATFPEVQALAADTGIGVSGGALFRVEDAGDDGITVGWEDLTEGRFLRKNYDLVALCADVAPAQGIDALAEIAGVALDADGYIDGEGVDGVFMAGCATGPMTIPDSIVSAREAAAAAVEQLNPRLLDEDYAAPPSGEASTAPQATDAKRARIEQMLYALLEKTEA